MSDPWFIRAAIALEFIGLVTVSAVYLGGPWTIGVIVGAGIVVFGLVGGPGEVGRRRP